ncbi:site-specific DNA-methyltransferase [Peptostreptococcus anaerobius]|uniref:Methyltransferase n=2 Tax=Peptostreptococcus porci TaxID=2652282 RepID=A0A6N7XDE6_9FIRM|nr:site-specific DNA-methyltransferase [Peptostreptococcus porci]
MYKDNSSRIYLADTLTTTVIPDDYIDLIVTSPPYNLDIDYKSCADNQPYDEYLKFTNKWLKKCYRWLKQDGRMCLNIPLDKNKGGHQSVGADITTIAKEVGFKYHSTVVWNEGNISKSSAWGSWMSASSPYVIAPVELILLLYKDSWKKTSGSRKSDILREEFISWTNGVWTFNGESKRKIGHPAPFPVELPKRCIKLFSFIDDIVLDPFMGSGSTLVAARQLSRRGIGIDFEEDYCNIAINRIKNET